MNQPLPLLHTCHSARILTLTNRNENPHINLRILNRLQNHRRLITVRAVEADTGGELGEELDVVSDVGEGGVASVKGREASGGQHCASMEDWGWGWVRG